MVHASACAVQRNNRKVQRCGCCLQPLPLRGFDEECRGFIAEQYEVTGLNIHSQSTPTRIEKQSDGSLTLHVKKKDGQEEAIEGLETILMATGRSPNTQNMNLEKVSSVQDALVLDSNLCKSTRKHATHCTNYFHCS